jgi:hypothetical protein
MDGGRGEKFPRDGKLMGMQPKKLGQVLGIGARVAAKTIRERATQAQAASAAARTETPGAPAPRAAEAATPAAGSGARDQGVTTAGQAAVKAAEGGRRLARGAGRFGGAMVGPFARAGGILALQITGVFFALFALFFLSHAAQTIRAAGWHDRHGQVYAGLGLVFAWFTVSSFWRARKKGR